MGFYRDQKDWKILNVDCSSSKVTTRQMTDEEKAKYGTAEPQTKIRLGDEAYMAKLKISTEELLANCKEFGTDWQASQIILRDDEVIISGEGIEMNIAWDELGDFIMDLQEVKRIVNE